MAPAASGRANELPEPGAHRLDVADQDALGDLEGQVAGREPRGLQRVHHLLDQLRLLELAAGQVDVDRQRRRLREPVLPASQLEAGLEQHPAADRPEQARLLGVVQLLDVDDHPADGRPHGGHLGLEAGPGRPGPGQALVDHGQLLELDVEQQASRCTLTRLPVRKVTWPKIPPRRGRAPAGYAGGAGRSRR
jgi:hypothetical protein